MQILPVESLRGYVGAGIKQVENQNKTQSFDTLLKSAMNMIDNTNELQKAANQAEIDFALDKIDIADANIAVEKALVALQFTAEIRDKVLEAYNEIMRIQM